MKEIPVWIKKNKFQMKSSGCEVVRVDELTKFLGDNLVLDPPDLDKMNLAALRVLNEIRERAVKCDLRKGGARCGCCELVLTDLESAADLKVPEILVQAKAWKLLEDWLNLDPHDKHLLTKSNLRLRIMPDFLKNARAEIEKGDKDNE